jgi:hypothetical protein
MTSKQLAPAVTQADIPKGSVEADKQCTMCLVDRFHDRRIGVHKTVSDLKACPSCRGELKEQKLKEATFNQANSHHDVILRSKAS